MHARSVYLMVRGMGFSGVFILLPCLPFHSLLNADKRPSGSYARLLAILLESVAVSLY